MIMRKNRIVIFALLFSFILSSFSLINKTEEEVTCPSGTTYIWLGVRFGIALPCANFTQISRLSIDYHLKFSTDLDSDMSAFTMTQTAAAQGICSITNTYVCAVGYALVASNFEAAVINGVEYWRPKATAIAACAVCREDE